MGGGTREARHVDLNVTQRRSPGNDWRLGGTRQGVIAQASVADAHASRSILINRSDILTQPEVHARKALGQFCHFTS